MAAPSLHDIYRVYLLDPRADGTVAYRLAGRFALAGGQLDILEDHDGILQRNFNEGHATPRTLQAIEALRHSAYMRIISEYGVQHGEDESLIRNVDPEDDHSIPQPPVQQPAQPVAPPPNVWHYQRAGMDAPQVLEAIDGRLLLNGNDLSPDEISQVVSNIESGSASIRYPKIPTVERVTKMEMVLEDLSKIEKEVAPALRELRNAVNAGHISADSLKAITKYMFVDHMVPGVGNRHAYKDFVSRPKKGFHIRLDGNDFGTINKMHGFETGDGAIRAMGGAMRSAMDESVGSKHGKLFRIGGDEFHAFVPSHEHAANFLRDLRDKLASIPPVGGTHNLSVSAGIAPDQANAELSLMQAKNAKKSMRYQAGQAKMHVYSAKHGHVPLDAERPPLVAPAEDKATPSMADVAADMPPPKPELPKPESVVKSEPEAVVAKSDRGSLQGALEAALPEADDLRQKQYRGNDNIYAGHCYVASEAMYHLLGGHDSGWVPQFIRHEGNPHWYLRNTSGEILDATAKQFKTPVPYDSGVAKGFLTKQPSKRAVDMMTRIQSRMQKSEALQKSPMRYDVHPGWTTDLTQGEVKLHDMEPLGVHTLGKNLYVHHYGYHDAPYSRFILSSSPDPDFNTDADENYYPVLAVAGGDRKPDGLHMTALGVHPAHAGKGYGRALLAHLTDHHGRIVTTGTVSGQATDAFKKLAGQYKVKLGRDGTEEPHEIVKSEQAPERFGDADPPQRYPPVTGTHVEDLKVRSEIPNQSSIGASLATHHVLPGVRMVQMSHFTGDPKKAFYSADDQDRVSSLVQQIGQSKELNPLIVVHDKDGPYILEGGHRWAALGMMGKKTFPAQVVLDLDSEPEGGWAQHLGEDPHIRKSEGETPEEPRYVRPDGKLVSEPGYHYHATNDERTHDIARQGLRAHLPHEFTDQDCWPDGKVEPRIYFSPKAHAVWAFAPEEGRPVVLRVHQSKANFRTESTGDTYTHEPIPPQHIEILHGDGKWRSLAMQKSELHDGADFDRLEKMAPRTKVPAERPPVPPVPHECSDGCERLAAGCVRCGPFVPATQFWRKRPIYAHPSSLDEIIGIHVCDRHGQDYTAPDKAQSADMRWERHEIRKSEPPTKEPGATAPAKWDVNEHLDATRAATDMMRGIVGDAAHEFTDGYDFRREYVPLSAFAGERDWPSWYEEEKAANPEHYEEVEPSYIKRPHAAPVFLTYEDGRHIIHDGEHRIGIAHKAGMTHVPAFVGYPKAQKSEPGTPGATAGKLEKMAPPRKLYHITDKADFKLDPNYEPANNTTLGGTLGKGIYLTHNVGHWTQGYGYWRPWVAEFEVPHNIHELPGVRGGYGGEVVVPPQHYDKVKLTRVIPLDAHVREEFNDYGWTENAARGTFDGQPLTGPEHRLMPRLKPGYRFAGDVRQWPIEQQNAYAQRVKDFASTQTNAIAPPVDEGD